MKNRKKAELQRKLFTSPLPKPPSGLAERIKRDIPSEFGYTADNDRSRFSPFNALSLRVAASILVLVGGAYFAIRLMSEVQQTDSLSRAKTSIVLPQRVPAPAAPAPQLADAKEIALAKQADNETAAAPKPVESVPVKTRHIEVAQAQAKAKDAARDERRSVDRLDKGATANGVAAGALAFNEPLQAAAEKAAVPTSTVAEFQANEEVKVQSTSQPAAITAPVAAPAPPPPAAARAEAITAVAEAPVVADKKKLDVRAELFGISTDRQSFDRIKLAIEHGDRPAADSIDVAALVNYFAGVPDHMRHPVALDLEASTLPVRNGNPTALVRLTIDTEETIYDAKLDIVFDDIAVAEYHRIGGNHIASATEPVMNANRSVTALYEVKLKPKVRQLQAVATATLTYRGAEGAQILTRRITYGEAHQAWKTKSRRHRLATLGAIWAETLRTQAAGTDVARKADELSKQEPHDEKAKELATLATASSRLRSSSPTGSGR
jgi:hypothetical protein